jgi:SAM-dependent methyltransferase
MKTYSKDYNQIQYKGISGFAHKIYHKKLEGKFNNKTNFSRILEIGSGSGEHFKYIKHRYSTYFMTEYDTEQISKLKKKFYRNKKIKIEYADIERLKYNNDYFDRIILTCVLHHLKDIPTALNEIRRVTKDQGTISIYLPSDPGILYRFTRKIAMFRKKEIRLETGQIINRNVLHAIEHPNHIQAISDLIMYLFRNDEIKVTIFPFKMDMWNLNLFYVYQIKKNEN